MKHGLASVNVHDRLIAQNEQILAQSRFDLLRPIDLGHHLTHFAARSLEEMKPVTTLRLCIVTRHVRLGEQIDRCAVIVINQSDTNTAGHRERVAALQEAILAHPFYQFITDAVDVLLADLTDEQEEFIASEPGNDVGLPNAVLKTASNTLQ